MNNARYSTYIFSKKYLKIVNNKSSKLNLPTFNEINELLKTYYENNASLLNTDIKIIGNFIISENQSIIENYSKTKKNKIYVYDQGNLVPGSPFSSIRSAAKAVNTTSETHIKNIVNTGKIFKNKYTFFDKNKF
jgi:hypothetical protein